MFRHVLAVKYRHILTGFCVSFFSLSFFQSDSSQIFRFQRFSPLVFTKLLGYSYLPNKRAGSNKHVEWKMGHNQINVQGQIKLQAQIMLQGGKMLNLNNRVG